MMMIIWFAEALSSKLSSNFNVIMIFIIYYAD